MPTAATVTDVEDLLGRSLTSDSARVGRLLDRAEGIVSGEFPGLTFGAVANEVVTVETDGDDYVVLPNYPVTAIASVTIAGTALPSTGYAFDVLGNVRRIGSSVDAITYAEGARVRWPDAGVAVVFTYSYGFASAATPDVISSVVAELAAARVANPEQVTQESMGDRSHSYATAAGAGDDLTEGQRRRLRHWNRRRFASARMRS